MSAIDFLLHESSVGYAIFEVVHQADTVGNRLKEVQDAAQDLAKFGKMVKLVNFAPYRYNSLTLLIRSCTNNNLGELPKLSKISTSSPRVFCRIISGPI